MTESNPQGAIVRGEPFVKWVDPLDPTSQHDGVSVFGHFMTMKYISIHEPEMSVYFDSDGALNNRTVHFDKLQRYIWAHAKVLARRCHDMLKQQCSTKTHSIKAWEPLQRWIFGVPGLNPIRMTRLMTFKKTDVDLFKVVAKCLWRLAHGANHPWGVAALKPHGYSAVPTVKKVYMTE